MIRINRRSFVAGASMMMLARPAHAARTVTDSAGRSVELPDRIDQVFAAGGPASVVVYAMRPETMVGWPRALRAEERPYIAAGQRDLPEVGLLTGRGDTANIETVLKIKPDLIVDYGSVRQTFASLADSVQQRTGIPYVLIDGRFEATASSFRLLGNIFGAPERGEALAKYSDDLFKSLDTTLAGIPEDQRPRVYLARGPDGLETGLRGSINTEIIERAGGRNVADAQDQRRGIANVSPEQILAWNPDIIVTWDRNFHDKVAKGGDSVWQGLKAVKDGRVYLAPTAPFGWIDRPPSVNRLIGLRWLANLFHGARFPFDIRQDTRAFYRQFYHVDVADSDLDTLIAWADGKPPSIPARR
ncbi:MAG: iron complex transport system substrate-binding protein [Afipia broomeae]|jgi:iron complex transport system substrate-binding protein|nr:MAG: iron ABC transporter substrate-binding protein [Bradyrhizobiaceae bacterium]